jgi:hypothetical protein
MELAHSLVAPSCRRVHGHEPAMYVFSRGVVLQRLAQPPRRRAVGAATRQFLGQIQQQAYVQLREVFATFCTPVLVAILREEIAAVGLDCSLVRADV